MRILLHLALGLRLHFAGLLVLLVACGARSPLASTRHSEDGNGGGTLPLWAMRGGSASNRRVANEVGTGSLRLLWTFAPGAQAPWSTPVVANDGSLYFVAFGYMGDILLGPTLYCLSSDGTERWTYDGVNRSTQPALGADGTLYIGVRDELVALNRNGQVRWAHDVHASLDSAIVVADDGTILFTAGGSVYAVSPQGARSWVTEVTTPDASLALAVAGDGTIFVTANHSPRLVALSRAGRELWRTELPLYTDLPPPAPAVGPEGTLYVGYDGLHAYSSTGELKWTFKNETWGSVSSPAVGDNGTVYVTLQGSTSDGLEGRLTALSSNGVELWSAPTKFSATLQPPTLGSDGNIYTAEPVQLFQSNGQRLSSFEHGEQILTPPSIGWAGTYYLGSSTGLHAFGD